MLNFMSVMLLYQTALDFCKVDYDTKLQFAFDRGIIRSYSPNIDEHYIEQQIWHYLLDYDAWDELETLLTEYEYNGSKR